MMWETQELVLCLIMAGPGIIVFVDRPFGCRTTHVIRFGSTGIMHQRTTLQIRIDQRKGEITLHMQTFHLILVDSQYLTLHIVQQHFLFAFINHLYPFGDYRQALIDFIVDLHLHIFHIHHAFGRYKSHLHAQALGRPVCRNGIILRCPRIAHQRKPGFHFRQCKRQVGCLHFRIPTIQQIRQFRLSFQSADFIPYAVNTNTCFRLHRPQILGPIRKILISYTGNILADIKST